MPALDRRTPRFRRTCGRRQSVRWCAAILVSLALTPTLTARPDTVRPTLIDGGTAQQLAQWQQMVVEGRTDEASEALNTLANDHGDELVSVVDPSSGMTMLMPLERHLFDRLVSNLDSSDSARLSMELLSRFARRFDDSLRSRLESATAAVDVAALRDLAFESPLSDVSAQAQVMLGDLAWGDGRLDAAEHWWRMAESRSKDRSRLAKAASTTVDVSPADVDVDVAARRVMLDIARHDLAAAEAKLRWLRANAPDTETLIWGRTQKWAPILTPMLDLVPQSALPTSAVPSTGSANLITSGIDDWRPGRLRILWSTTWQELEAGTIQPLAWRNQLMMIDATGFTAFELDSGRRQFDVHPLSAPATRSDSSSVERFQSSELAPAVIDGNRLGIVIEPTDSEGRRARSMAMLCDLSSEGRLICVCEPPSDDLDFGSGLVLDRESMWLVTRPRSGTSALGIAKYEADSGRLIWHAVLPPATAIDQGQSAGRPLAQLSLAGNWLILATPQGQIAAIDGSDGTMRWMLSDTSVPPTTRRLDGRSWSRHRSRPLAAPYRTGGLLICVLPSRPNLLALDEITGRVNWESQIPASDFDSPEMAGQVGDALFATGRRVWQLELSSGRLLDRGLDNPFPAESTAVMAVGPGHVSGSYLLWTARHRNASDWFYAWNVTRGTWAVPPYQLHLPGVGLSRLWPHDRFWLAANAERLTVLSVE